MVVITSRFIPDFTRLSTICVCISKLLSIALEMVSLSAEIFESFSLIAVSLPEIWLSLKRICEFLSEREILVWSNSVLTKLRSLTSLSFWRTSSFLLVSISLSLAERSIYCTWKNNKKINLKYLSWVHWWSLFFPPPSWASVSSWSYLRSQSSSCSSVWSLFKQM